MYFLLPHILTIIWCYQLKVYILTKNQFEIEIIQSLKLCINGVLVGVKALLYAINVGASLTKLVFIIQ